MKESNWLLSKIIWVITLAMLCFTFSCQKQDTEADIAAINEVYSQSTLAVSTGDVDLYLSIFTEDAVVMPPGSPAAIGKEQIRPVIEGIFGLFDLELPYTVDEVGVPGDWAFARSSFQYSMTPKESGETTTSAGKELAIFKRQADGSWKIYIQCYNFDAPQPATKVAGTSRAPGLAKMAQEDDADAICSEMYDQYMLALETGDVEFYMSLWDDNGVQMPPDAPTIIGKEGIRSGTEALFGMWDIEGDIFFEEAEVAGDWLFGTCTGIESLTPKEGGASATFNAKDLWVLRRQADGSWKIRIDCWNFDGPPTVE